MGCSSGVMSIDLVVKFLTTLKAIGCVLVVVTECISLNWYFSDDRSMLVTNCIFRMGCTVALVTNDPTCCDAMKMELVDSLRTQRGAVKIELVDSLRTHRNADDASYRVTFQFEDTDGNTGVALKKDLLRVAREGLRRDIRCPGSCVLPVLQLFAYEYNVVVTRWSGEGAKPGMPDFTTTFDHICVHMGGKVMIKSIVRLMKLGDEVTELTRMTLHRFCNTSSSLVFYDLACFKAKGRLKKGDKMWMFAFGTRFRVCSLVWQCLRDPDMDPDSPWIRSIHRKLDDVITMKMMKKKIDEKYI